MRSHHARRSYNRMEARFCFRIIKLCSEQISVTSQISSENKSSKLNQEPATYERSYNCTTNGRVV